MSFVLGVAEEITAALDAMIAEISPSAIRKPMYGGIVFQNDPQQPSRVVCGHFTYKQHVGLEFSNGYLLEDPHAVLEGKGKFRRHIKLHSVTDLKKKHVREYLERAFASD
ncbi:MAG: DUF1801 domain-containing protein [Pseudomonadota bacterium]